MVGDRLVLSDGTSALRFFDPATMKENKRVTVRVGGRPLTMINELETIDGQIWANIWILRQSTASAFKMPMDFRSSFANSTNPPSSKSGAMESPGPR